jgi:hypothetical protein
MEKSPELSVVTALVRRGVANEKSAVVPTA